MDSVQYLSVKATSTGLAEYSGEQRVIFIPSSELEAIEFAYGFAAERIILQLVFRGTLLGLALCPLADLFRVMGNEYTLPNVHPRLFIVGIFFALFGTWVLWTALRRGPYLRVSTRRGIRKLHLRGKVEEAAVVSFIARAKQLFHARAP